MQHEVGEVGAEHTGRVALRLADRAGVLEQRAQFLHRDRQVAAQQPLPEVVVEGASRRRLEEGDTAGVGRGVPGVLVGVVEAAQRPEERRQHGFPVGAGGGGDAARDEARGVLQWPDVAHDRLGHPQRQVPYALVGHHQEDRQVPETAADPAQHGAAARGPVEGAARPGEGASRRGERGAGPVTGGPGKVPGHQRSRETSLGAQYRVRVLRRDRPPDFEAARLDRVPDLPQLLGPGALAPRVFRYRDQDPAVGHAFPALHAPRRRPWPPRPVSWRRTGQSGGRDANHRYGGNRRFEVDARTPDPPPGTVFQPAATPHACHREPENAAGPVQGAAV